MQNTPKSNFDPNTFLFCVNIHVYTAQLDCEHSGIDKKRK